MQNNPLKHIEKPKAWNKLFISFKLNLLPSAADHNKNCSKFCYHVCLFFSYFQNNLDGWHDWYVVKNFWILSDDLSSRSDYVKILVILPRVFVQDENIESVITVFCYLLWKLSYSSKSKDRRIGGTHNSRNSF